MKRPWLAPLAAVALVSPLPGGASTLARFAFVLPYDATTCRLFGVNGFWQDPVALPASTRMPAFIDLIGHGNAPVAMIGAPTSPSTVDEPLVPVLVTVGAVAFVIEQRRVRGRPATRTD